MNAITAAMDDAVTKMMEIQVADTRWDVAPTLLLITAVPGGREGHFTPIEITPHTWTLGPTWTVLQAMAKAANEIDVALPVERPRGHLVVGVALATEGWALALYDATDAEREEARQWCATHAIADHPAGIETKMVSAVDRTGRGYLAEHHRGEDGWHMAEHDIGGRIHDALVDLATSLARKPYLTGGGKR